MEVILIFFTIQGLMGAFDTLYHHEFKERLPWRNTAKKELYIHGVRNFFYFVIFISLGWLQWGGLLALVFATILIIEIVITLWDFVIEDKTRKLPATERITHTILAINYGAILALLVPELVTWINLATSFHFVDHGIWSWVMTLYGVGVLFWSFRDLLSSRQQAPKALPEIHLNRTNMKFLVTGGSGFIGSRLCQMLINAGHDITVLTRNKANAASKFYGRITLIDSLNQAQGGYDVIINLAGESLSDGRWTKDKKQKLYDSRLNTTKAIIDYIKNTNNKPSLLVNGSAIGFYGSSETAEFNETSDPADHGFTHDLCNKWEEKALLAKEYGVRVVTLRIGIVLGLEGGALSHMLFPFEFCLGGKMGSGRQWMSWVHIDDLIQLMAHIIDNDKVEGAVNATAPNPITNQEFTKALAIAMRRPAILTIPSFNLKLLLGEMADTLLLKGQKALPQKALDSGYQFRYENALDALKQILGRK
jgi:uncharacterized protein (TIGR01777 family)